MLTQIRNMASLDWIMFFNRKDELPSLPEAPLPQDCQCLAKVFVLLYTYTQTQWWVNGGPQRGQIRLFLESWVQTLAHHFMSLGLGFLIYIIGVILPHKVYCLETEMISKVLLSWKSNRVVVRVVQNIAHSGRAFPMLVGGGPARHERLPLVLCLPCQYRHRGGPSPARSPLLALDHPFLSPTFPPFSPLPFPLPSLLPASLSFTVTEYLLCADVKINISLFQQKLTVTWELGPTISAQGQE